MMQVFVLPHTVQKFPEIYESSINVPRMSTEDSRCLEPWNVCTDVSDRKK